MPIDIDSRVAIGVLLALTNNSRSDMINQAFVTNPAKKTNKCFLCSGKGMRKSRYIKEVVDAKGKVTNVSALEDIKCEKCNGTGSIKLGE